MTYLSLFSGIGGFDLGLDRAGFRCVGQVECDKAALSVLAHRWPSVPKFEDVRKFNVRSIAVRPDLICGGFPCQDLSVAGRRAGLAGERSGLFFEFMRIVGELAPTWVLIENVPGLLSSAGGRDMGIVVGRLGDMGYGWAYRVLDAQWFGLAQQRRRVFIVGCAGADVRRAAEVLFERESLPWDPPPSRQAGARVAAGLTSGTATGSGVNKPGRRREDDFNLAFGGNNTSGPIDVATACNAHGGTGRHDFESETFITAEGHDASEDGTGRGTPIVPFTFHQNGDDHANETAQHGLSRQDAETDSGHDRRRQGKPDRRREGRRGRSSGVLPAAAGECVSFQTRIARNGRGQPKEVVDSLVGSASGTHADSKPHVAYAGGVRRLTPKECCRLQGFPDDWIDGLGLSDSAKYRLLGNAVAVPVAEWIGLRLIGVTT